MTVAPETDREELRAQLLAAVDAIEPTLRACADEAERIGTLPEPAWRALHDAGLLRLKAPRELGGFEADPITQIEVIERVAYIDTSAGWCMFVGSGTLSLMAAWMPAEGIPDFLVDGRLKAVLPVLGGRLIGWSDVYSTLPWLIGLSVVVAAFASFVTLIRYTRV